MDAGFAFVVRDDDTSNSELLPPVDFCRYTSQLTCWSWPRLGSTYREMRRRTCFEFAGRGTALASQRHHRVRPVDRVFCVTGLDRKSTRLNSSHHSSSYAVFC